MQISPYVIPGLKFHYGLPHVNDKLTFIETLVTGYFGETVESMKERSNLRNRVLCRFICYYLIREHTHLSLLEIAHRFERTNHSTIVNGLAVLKDLMKTDEKIRADVQLLEAKIDERK